MIALFVALTGTAVATTSALITGNQIKNNSITGLDVKNRSLRPIDFRGSVRGPRGLRGLTGATGATGAAGAPGAAGAKGDKGDKGDPGTPATKLFAEISPGATPAVLYGQGVTGVTNAGTFYVVTFDRDISQCAPLGTTTGTSGNNVDSRINVVHRSGGPTQLNVRTYTGASENAVTNVYFSVAVFCP